MSKKYPYGYIPKIKYWCARFQDARNQEDRDRAFDNIAYFTKRHNDMYGPIDLDKFYKK